MEFTSKIDKNDIEFDRGSIGEVATSSPKVAKEEDKVKKKMMTKQKEMEKKHLCKYLGILAT